MDLSENLKLSWVEQCVGAFCPGANDIRDFIDALLAARKALAGLGNWQLDGVQGEFGMSER